MSPGRLDARLSALEQRLPERHGVLAFADQLSDQELDAYVAVAEHCAVDGQSLNALYGTLRRAGRRLVLQRIPPNLDESKRMSPAERANLYRQLVREEN
jgi:hypothetical protein